MPAEIIFHHDIGFDGNRWLASPPSSPLRQQKPPLQHQHQYQHQHQHSPRYQDSPRHSLPGTSRSNSHRRNSNNGNSNNSNSNSNSNSNNNNNNNDKNNNDNVDRHVRLAVDDILREHHDAIPFPNLQRQCRVFHRDSFSTISTRESEDPDARHRMTCTYAPLSSYNNNDGNSNNNSNNNNNNNEEEVKTTRSHEHDRLPIAISFPSDFGAEDDNSNNNSNNNNNNAKDTNGCPLEDVDVDVDVLDGYGSNDADDIVFVPGEEDVVSRSSSIEVVRDISKRVAAHKISETPLQQQQQQQQRSSWPQQQQQRQRQRRSWQPPQQHHHHHQQQQQQQKQRQAPQPPGSPARSNANSRKQRERWNTTDLVAVVDPAWSPPTALIPTTKATTATTTATTTTTASMASSLSPFRGRRLRKASLGSAAADPLPMRRDRDRSHTCEHEFEHEFAVRPLARDGSMVRVGSVATNESPPRPFKRFEI